MRIKNLSQWCSRRFVPMLTVIFGLALSCGGDPAATRRTGQAVDACCVDCNVCGNGVVEDGEACDDGNRVSGDGCSASCTVESCGDGIVEGDEQCDDGNQDFGDGCTPWCRRQGCGDGELDVATEECDDGNRDPGDGCDSQCKLEGPPAGVCGDGTVDRGEDCDDGNADGGDDCVSCRIPIACTAEAACGVADQCCPAGCSALDDPDCVARCGNGVCEPGEGGSIAMAVRGTAPVAACPADCEPHVSCDMVTACIDGDVCCPAGCALDTDCLPGTDSDGDGVSDAVEGAGDCDGDGVPDYLDADPCVTIGGGGGSGAPPDAGAGSGSGSGSGSAPPPLDAGSGSGSGSGWMPPPPPDAGAGSGSGSGSGSGGMPGPGSGSGVGSGSARF